MFGECKCGILRDFKVDDSEIIRLSLPFFSLSPLLFIPPSLSHWFDR